MVRKNSREQFLEIVNAHLSLREQGKKFDPAMVKVAEGIKEGRLMLADASYYSIKKAGGKANINIKKVAGLQNGVFTFMANKKIIIDERPMQEFITDNNFQVNLGTYILENPRFVRDDEEFEFTIELGEDAPEKTLIKVVLAGTSTVPA